EVPAAEQAAEHVAGPGVAGPFVLGQVAQDELADGGVGEPVALVEEADSEAAVVHHPPGVRFGVLGEHRQQGRLPAAVAADHTDPVPFLDAERDVVEEDEGAVGQGDILKIDEVHRLPIVGPGGDRSGRRPGSRQEEVPGGPGDALGVQAVGAVVVGGGAVAAELGTAGDADGALPVPAVLQGRGDLVCGGAGQVGPDHQHVGGARGGGEAVQPGPAAGARGGGAGGGAGEGRGVVV